MNKEYICNTCKSGGTIIFTPEAGICLKCGSPEDYTKELEETND